MQVNQTNIQEEWVNVLSKGLITIPKKMRDILGIKEGDITKVKIVGRTIVIEPKEEYTGRIFSKEEIREWLKEDELPKKLAKKIDKLWPDLP